MKFTLSTLAWITLVSALSLAILVLRQKNTALQLEFDSLSREHKTLQIEMSRMKLDRTVYDFKLLQHSDRLEASQRAEQASLRQREQAALIDQLP